MTRALAPALLGLVLTGGLLSATTAPAAADPDPGAPTDPVTTVTHLAVHAATLIATVEGGDATPTGRVVFTADGVRLGAARLDADPEPGVAHAVLPRRVRSTGSPVTIEAVYAGDDAHAASERSYRRVDPVVEAVVTSRHAAGASGWYRTPTTVTFLCTTGSAHADCPAAVTKRSTGVSAVLRRTVRADDGGWVRVEVANHHVDPWAPRLSVTRQGRAPYGRAARPVRCSASDARSGLDGRCTVSYGEVRRTGSSALRRAYVVRAVDRAGNQRVRRGAFAVRR